MRTFTYGAMSALVALGFLAACGGGSSEPPHVEPTEPTQAEREAAEQAAREQAERERLAREEAERQERERLEREARERAEREAAERAAAMLPFPLEPWSCDPSLAHIPGACGGDTSGRPHFGIWALPDADIADAERNPITHDSDGNDRRVFVGVDQGTEHIGTLPLIGPRGDADIRFGTLNDGAGHAAVERYLSQVAPNRTMRSSDRVRIIGSGATQQDRNRVSAAVRMVNAALPEDSKLTVDPLRPDLSLQHGMSGRTYFVTGDELPDTIHVEFVPGRDPAGGTAAARSFDLTDRAYVAFFQGSNSYRNEREAIILLAHEIMHALGLSGHVSASFQSIMKGTGEIHAVSQGGVRQPMSVLYPVDREVLRVLYSGDAASFGPWASTSLHIHGNAPHAGFGVAFRNGYAEPWAYGYLASYGLETNPELSGVVTWTGDLVGFTPNVEAVLGDATIRVHILTLRGTASFTELEHWAARQAPGAEGTGTTWLDGDLRYTIAVSSNDSAAGKAGAAPAFRESGGDDGRLTGIFTGASHEGAAGTLERPDLTAAFGASR